MTLFHLHDDSAAPAGGSRLTWARAAARLIAVLKTIHESIMAAKTRRLQRELMFHADSGDEPFCGQEIGRVPQRPMILGDKWDF
jgi:hypothetical protein